MPEYTPETVREDLTQTSSWRFKYDEIGPAFDRWLEARDRENLAIGWDEGFDAGGREAFEHDGPCIANPYRGDN